MELSLTLEQDDQPELRVDLRQGKLDDIDTQDGKHIDHPLENISDSDIEYLIPDVFLPKPIFKLF